jgi:hypothetical protein
MACFNCNYHEALNIVANDFGIRSGHIGVSPRVITANDEFELKNDNKQQVRDKSIINIVSQPWNISDFNYWNQFGITFDKLDEYNVFSAMYVYLIKGDKRITFNYSNNNPCYAYRFTNDGNYSYKIYWPLGRKSRKWLFSGGSKDDIEGYDQLPLSGETLILTKSLKDCICYNIVGSPAISLQGEGNILEQSLVDKLLKRFNKIVINYDNDDRGVIEAAKICRKYNFKSFIIDGAKDLSDYIKINGIDKAKLMVENKLKSI